MLFNNFNIMFNIIKLNEKDNIGVAPMPIPENTKINFDVLTKDEIPFGHKISLTEIKKGNFVYKYGQIIGTASNDILSGQHVHSHNLIFSEFDRKYEIKSQNEVILEKNNLFFKGYKRENEKAGTRNYIGLISTVNCSATVVKKISENINIHLLKNKFANIDGAVCLKHSSGCGMNASGHGMKVFNQTIEGFKHHPNFGKVYVIGLGCECAQISLYQNDSDKDKVEYLNIQDEGGTSEIINKVTKKIINN